MNEYIIEVKEVLTRNINVNADNTSDAIKKAFELYEDETIVLDYSDLKETLIDLKNYQDDEINESFNNFILNSAERMLANLSLEELSLIAFGSLSEAKYQYKKNQSLLG